jgi:cytoskeleton protein RodZ
MARKTKESNEAVQLTQNSSSSPDNVGLSGYDTHLRSRCGGALRTARESIGLSIQDIAGRLRLSSKQIEAIEADNFAILPEPTIVRGFIRNYAKQLKINAEPLLDAYNVIVPSVNPHELIVKPSANMKMTSYKRPNTGRNLLLGLLVLVGLGGWLFYQSYVEKPSPTVPSAGMQGMEPLPEVALPAAERSSDALPATELTLPPADAMTSLPPVEGVVANPVDAGVSSVQPSNAPPVNVTAPTTMLPVTALPNAIAKLEFSATQETWVNVIDASGRKVYSKTIFAGSRESIDVTPPVNITVGNAGATSLNMNGRAVELAPHSRNNVAHIKLE